MFMLLSWLSIIDESGQCLTELMTLINHVTKQIYCLYSRQCSSNKYSSRLMTMVMMLVVVVVVVISKKLDIIMLKENRSKIAF